MNARKILAVATFAVLLGTIGTTAPGTAAPPQEKPASHQEFPGVKAAATPALKPDLVVVDFDIVPGVGTPNVCNVVRLNLTNQGSASLPESAYASTVAAGGVKIVVTRSPSTLVVSAMLVDVDSGKRVKPAHSDLGQNMLFLPKFPDGFAMANGVKQTFTVTVDGDNKVPETDDTVNNLRTEDFTCNVH